MINLSLLKNIKDPQIVDNDIEFFKVDKPLRVLSNLQPLTILVGANNTRKSRFFRSLMECESFVVWETELAFSNIIEGLEENIHDLDQMYAERSLVKFRYASSYANQTRDLFQKLTVTDASDLGALFLQSSNIVAVLENILSQMLSSLSKDDFRKCKVNAAKMSQALELVYEILAGLHSQQTNKQNVYIEQSKHAEELRILSPERLLKDDEIDLDSTLNLLENLIFYLNQIASDLKFERINPSIIYIPVLRTAKNLSSGRGDDIFEDLIRKQIPKLNPNVKIHSGLSLNTKILESRNGTKSAYQDFLAFESFIGSTFFDGKEINIIAQFNGAGEIHISLPNELENVSVNHLGDGVTGIINLLYPLFTAPKNSWVFIEEPENNLHPAFQTIFVKTLSENRFIKEKNLRIFINTHSNHVLVNSYLSKTDIGVLVFSKRDAQSSRIASYIDNEKNTLNLLGVLNTSVLISNCLIWVEGVTDRLYVKAYLKAYVDSMPKSSPLTLREGLDYAFVEYGGSNLVHYQFDTIDGQDSEAIKAFYTNNRILVLADRDKNSKNREVFKEVCNDHFVYKDTGLLEIENVIPEAILRDFLAYLTVSDADIAKVNFGLLNSEKLGLVFDGVRFDNKRTIKLKAKHGGTLTNAYKIKLAEFFYQKIMKEEYKWKDLQGSEHIVDITESIIDFIKKSKS